MLGRRPNRDVLLNRLARLHVKEDDAGRISYGSFANAITGCVPG
jgi:hypothetical protein